MKLDTSNLKYFNRSCWISLILSLANVVIGTIGIVFLDQPLGGVNLFLAGILLQQISESLKLSEIQEAVDGLHDVMKERFEIQ